MEDLLEDYFPVIALIITVVIALTIGGVVILSNNKTAQKDAIQAAYEEGYANGLTDQWCKDHISIDTTTCVDTTFISIE